MVDYNTKTRSIRVRAVAWIALFAGAAVGASESTDTRLYELTTRTGMPHLEESLRYTTTTMARCLSTERLMTAFDVLSHESLRTCRLDSVTRDAHSASYALHCESGEITGEATWNLAASHQSGTLTGTLNVKMGGKNMTFFQRVIAKPLGKCPREDA